MKVKTIKNVGNKIYDVYFNGEYNEMEEARDELPKNFRCSHVGSGLCTEGVDHHYRCRGYARIAAVFRHYKKSVKGLKVYNYTGVPNDYN